ncbi:MAG TPA: sigma 54 modulation/S30EA ribosomal C-terminal domain-containing protein, partial [Marmoricola sp.]|nr:sigma 54 modulation/S30EA ribosomal C-terminal domain-containing protein [Marmoricola sp.]
MTTSTRPLSIAVTHRGNVGPGAATWARAEVAAVLDEVHESVISAHVVLDWDRDQGRERPAIAQVDVDLNGTHLRAMSVRPTMHEALDEMKERLRRRVRRFENRERAKRHQAAPANQEWHEDDPPRSAPTHFLREADEREIVRHKAHPDLGLTPDEAAYEMELLDHDFYLFRNTETGSPAVLRRVDPHSCAVDNLPPMLTEEQARARLDVSGEPFAFY